MLFHIDLERLLTRVASFPARRHTETQLEICMQPNTHNISQQRPYNSTMRGPIYPSHKMQARNTDGGSVGMAMFDGVAQKSIAWRALLSIGCTARGSTVKQRRFGRQIVEKSMGRPHFRLRADPNITYNQLTSICSLREYPPPSPLLHLGSRTRASLSPGPPSSREPSQVCSGYERYRCY